jgi:hypothetical protein
MKPPIVLLRDWSAQMFTTGVVECVPAYSPRNPSSDPTLKATVRTAIMGNTAEPAATAIAALAISGMRKDRLEIRPASATC